MNDDSNVSTGQILAILIGLLVAPFVLFALGVLFGAWIS